MVLDALKDKSLKRISLISYDIVGKKMAGPGIRFFEFAKILSRSMDVTLHTPNRVDIDIEGVKLKHYNTKNFNSLARGIENAEIILIQGHILYYFPFLKNFSSKYVLV